MSFYETYAISIIMEDKMILDCVKKDTMHAITAKIYVRNQMEWGI